MPSHSFNVGKQAFEANIAWHTVENNTDARHEFPHIIKNKNPPFCFKAVGFALPKDTIFSVHFSPLNHHPCP